jgi:hypothetical protein
VALSVLRRMTAVMPADLRWRQRQLAATRGRPLGARGQPVLGTLARTWWLVLAALVGTFEVAFGVAIPIEEGANLDHDPGDTLSSGVPAPMLAIRVRAGVGRPGASAHAEYRSRRATELAVWTHSLPWRIGAVLAVGLAAWLLATQVAAHLAALAGVTMAAGLAWRLRFRDSPGAVAWRRGAIGECRTARLLSALERRGWAVLHDLAIPGTHANIDHLVIGPGGVVVIDTKQYRGRLWLDSYGLLWHGRQLLVAALRKVRWEVDQADEILGDADVQVVAIMAVHGA